MMTSSDATPPAGGMALVCAFLVALFAGSCFLCVNGFPAWGAFAIPPFSAYLDRLSFELIKSGVKSAEKICVGSVTDQFVVMIRNGYFDVIRLALMRENHMCLGFTAPIIQKFPDFLELGCQFNGLLRRQHFRQLYVTPSVSYFHKISRERGADALTESSCLRGIWLPFGG
jgi:hypothetical protein